MGDVGSSVALRVGGVFAADEAGSGCMVLDRNLMVWMLQVATNGIETRVLKSQLGGSVLSWVGANHGILHESGVSADK